MEINWNEMTAISTVFLTLFTLGLMLATFLLAYFAYKALGSWKEEIREKKKYELLLKTKTLLQKIESHIEYIQWVTMPWSDGADVEEQVKEYLSELEVFSGIELLEVKQEFPYINFTEFAELLYSIYEETSPRNIKKKITKNQTDISMILKETIDELRNNKVKIQNLIKQALSICDEEIKKFYTK